MIRAASGQIKRSWRIAALALVTVLAVTAGSALAAAHDPGRVSSSALTGRNPLGGALLTSNRMGAAQTPIKHVIFILKENRSYDNYFGQFPNANGATTGKMSNGTTVTLGVTPEPMPNDIGHGQPDFAVAYDKGKMDGFDKQKGAFSSTGANLAYTQLGEAQIPNYWLWAKTYGLGDNMFSDFKGSSYTNNLFMVAAQAGREDPTLNYYSVAGIPQSPTKPNQIRWGCDSAPDTLVAMLGPLGQRSTHFPCFGFKSLPDELQASGVSWSYYADRTSMSSVHEGIGSMSSVRYDPAKWANAKPLSSFIPDAQAGRLPAVTWITGDHLDHPVHTGCEGENEASTFINAVMSGPDWSSTAIFMTWDEWGGFYDHVAPPQKDNISYGFRVPIVAISPFTKTGPSAGGGYVSHMFYSFGSLLKFAEVNWNLPPLTTRDAAANDLMDFFNFSGAPRPAVLTQIHACHALTPAEQLIWKGEIDD